VRTRIRIEIDHLLLEGFSPLEAHRIVEAVESELVARLTADTFEADALSTRIEQIDAGSLKWNGFGSARAVGRQVADAVTRGGSL
jgi:hypothetical protein